MSWRAPNALERFLLADTRERWPELIPLARLLVLAPRIEPLLLRNARRQLLPTADAQLESQLWFSPLVAARSSREIVLHLGIARELAGQLRGAQSCPGDAHAQPEQPAGLADRAAPSEPSDQPNAPDPPNPPELDEVWTFTREHTRHWSAEDRLERDLRYHALRGDDDDLTDSLQAILKGIAAETDPTSDESRRIALSRLAKRTLPSIRLGLGQRSADKARLLARYAALALGDGGDWSGTVSAEPGAPDALPAWLSNRLPPPLARARLGVELRWDGQGVQVLHLVDPRDAEPCIELPSPLPGRLHVAPAGRVGAWHPANRDSRIRIDPPAAVLRLSTLDGRQWELVATDMKDAHAAIEPAPPPLLLVHAAPDREQAQAIAEWLRGQQVPVELLTDVPPEPGKASPSGIDTEASITAGPGQARVVRLWTRAARDLWAKAGAEPPTDDSAGLLLRTEPVEAPAAGTTTGQLLDWQDWQRLAESEQAAALVEALGRWWRAGEILPKPALEPEPELGPEREPEGDLDAERTAEPALEPESPATESAAEIERLLAEIADPSTTPPRRLAIGDRLAELGDPRPGVGTVEIELPDQTTAPRTRKGETQTVHGISAAMTPEVETLLKALNDPNTTPPRRLAIGDELEKLGDPRPGVGLRPDGLPDIAWVEIPGGAFIYQDDETRELPTFWLARYPVTNAQFQAFVDDGGYKERRWWQQLKRPKPDAPRWSQSNRPRTKIDWYEAVAFTRWFNARLGLAEGSIRLPTELEWEKAARGERGLRYPWGNDFESGFANVDEKPAKQGDWYLEQTTAVGLYPHGRSPYGVEDLAGTVWEWCLNKYDDLDLVAADTSAAARALRGGSWLLNPDLARADNRSRYLPVDRNDLRGFRLCSSVPIEPVR